MVICYLLGGKILLPCKHPGRVARDRLDQAEDKISRGHEIKREDIKLNADPQHQRYAEYRAQDGSGTTVFQQQHGGGQIGQAVDDQQCNAGELEILKQYAGKWQHLKIGQHRVHTHDAARRLNQHAGRASHRADSNKQRPENQPLTSRLIA